MVVLFSWVSVRVGLPRLPAGMNRKVMAGTERPGGIGFTMSLFIAGLGLGGDWLDDARIDILTRSAVSPALSFAGVSAGYLPPRRVA